MTRKPIILALSLFLAILTLPSASGIYNGDLAVGDNRVVALIKGIDGVRPSCSASLINPQIVVSAAHCLGGNGTKYTSEVFDPKDLWVALPGSDLNLDDTTKRVRVMRVLLTNGYDSTWNPEKGIIITQKDDIAFYLLEKPLVENYSIEIASELEVAEIKNNRLLITHIGYGLQDLNSVDGKPYLVQLRAFTNGSSRYGNHPASESKTIASEETGVKALCGGDSGSPWYANIGGIEKLVAVTVSASGCQGIDSGRGGTMGTVISPYSYLISSHWQKFLKDLPNLKKVNSGIDPTLPKIQRSGGCDAYVDATLQVFKDGVWADLMPAQGWEKVATCTSTHPYQPWVRADLPTGTQIRWNIYSNGNWSVFTDPVTYTNPIDERATPIPTPTKVISVKFIKCVKGKNVRVVKSHNPKCPRGYKILK